jgi:branched-chain amino acid transport system ATP-binding protein
LHKRKNVIKEKAKEVVDFLNLGHLSNELAGNLIWRTKKIIRTWKNDDG